MSCLCEDCGMNERNFGIMNYSDEFPCHEPHCCRDCSCFDECMEQEDEEENDDEDYDIKVCRKLAPFRVADRQTLLT